MELRRPRWHKTLTREREDYIGELADSIGESGEIMSSEFDSQRPTGKFSPKRVLSLAVPVLLLGLLALVVVPSRIEQVGRKETDDKVIERLGLKSASPARLDSRFSDADGDLVADAPQDSAKLVTPETIVFSSIAGPDAAEELAAWNDFAQHLGRAIGVKVEAISYPTVTEQTQAFKEGKLHVSGFNTGAVATAVTTGGFVPLCTFGREDGTVGSPMRIIVPSGSPITKLQQLKGRTVAFTLPDSNSGCKAVIVLLREDGMLPQRDYKWLFSGSHQESIKGVISGLYDAAPVSDDILQRAVAQGDAPEDKFRVIYESEKFPPATFGCAYNLPPELVEKIRQAFLEYSWKDTSLEKEFGAMGAAKFVPVSYKQDFALIRRIDDAFRKSPGDTAQK